MRGARWLGVFGAMVILGTARPASADDSAWSDPQFTWGVVATGTGALMLGSGAYFIVRSNQQKNDSAFEDYKAGVPEGRDACETAERDGRTDITDICDGTGRNRTLGLVLLGAGVASTTTGIVLLATRDSEPQQTARRSGWVVLPEAGPDGGRVRLRVTF